MLVERLPGMHEDLGSIPSTTETGVGHIPVILGFRKWKLQGQKVQGDPQIHAEFEASPGYVRPCLQTRSKIEMR